MTADCQYILDLWSTNPKRASQILKHDRTELYDQIFQMSGNSFSEKAWKWTHKTVPLCRHCNNSTKFLDFRRGFADYCSRKCTANSTTVLSKKVETSTEKYGVTHYSKTAEYKQKFEKTISDRYGVTNPGQIPELKQIRARQKQLTFFNNLVEEIKEFSTPNFSFEEYTVVRDSTLSWNCILCNSKFLSNTFGKLPKCSTCFPSGNYGGQSSIEKDVLYSIREFYQGEIIENSRNIIPPKELDLYFPDKQFAIEVNGVYWHSDKHISNTYHYDKFKMCQEAGVRLLMITDNEWKNNKSLIVSMIKHRLGITENKVYGRHCILQNIDSTTAKEFLDKNHIHGYSKASIHLGLYYNNQLVSVFSCSTRNRFKKGSSDIEIVRLAFSTSVIGALGKFIAHLRILYPKTKITTFADLRYGDGNVYLKNNFELVHTTKPGYWYFLNGKMYHRLSWQKSKLVSLGYDVNLTEKAIMNELGAIRVYDCGHNYFELK